MGTATSTAAPEWARWPRLVAAPHPQLRSMLVRGYAGFTEATTPRRLVLPATASVPLVIKLVDSVHRPPAFVLGPQRGFSVLEGDCVPSYLELLLAPLGAYRLLGLPMGKLSGQLVDLVEVLGPAGRRLAEQLRETPSWRRRFALVDGFLLGRLEGGPQPAPEVAWAWQRLVATVGAVPISQLAREVGWSHKYLIAWFGQQVGLRPKTTARLVRFQGWPGGWRGAGGGWPPRPAMPTRPIWSARSTSSPGPPRPPLPPGHPQPTGPAASRPIRCKTASPPPPGLTQPATAATDGTDATATKAKAAAGDRNVSCLTTGGRNSRMERTAVNPWAWSVKLGFDQGQLVEGHRRELICSGQDAVDANGNSQHPGDNSQHPGDMAAQLGLALDNLEAVLADADMTLANVVRLNIYTTDVDTLLQHVTILTERFEGTGERFASTLLGVARLAAPQLLVALEATAMD